MAEYTSGTERTASMVSSIADPVPLGLSALAFTTAVLGCSYASFIVPSSTAGISLTVAAALFYGGIVQILAGMWEFKKDNTIAATIFSSYGGFLVAFGVVFLPGFGIFSALRTNVALLVDCRILFRFFRSITFHRNAFDQPVEGINTISYEMSPDI